MAAQEATTITKVLESGYELASNHIGVRNVHQRIKLVFGPKYGLALDGFQRSGTTVTICIPLIGDLSHRNGG
jgi:two-component system sensor histidine kinase YesM